MKQKTVVNWVGRFPEYECYAWYHIMFAFMLGYLAAVISILIVIQQQNTMYIRPLLQERAETRVETCKEIDEDVYDCTDSSVIRSGWYHAVTTTVTAYTSRRIETDDTPCLAAKGHDICRLYAAGTKVCASNAHPIGTVLYVPGYGRCVVLDRMNRRYRDRVDVYMGRDVQAAREWGKRTLAVEIR